MQIMLAYPAGNHYDLGMLNETHTTETHTMKTWKRDGAGWYDFENDNGITGYIHGGDAMNHGMRWYVTMDGEGDWGGFATLKEAKRQISMAYNGGDGMGIVIPCPGQDGYIA